ncbi:alpha/beta fold hydrolase [Vibrio mexicanus]|uniref:alpha/beta fold hydrolase n=1 Tax=Vibrio mexicanus TaxID=1004326 RepID=UPI00063C9932|nr:alpha/beta hydrolase [Vibrio mexicanus]
MFENQYPVSSGHIAALEIGDANMSPISIVFLHGWLDNAASFETTMLALHAIASSFHLCAIDLPGHGNSTHKPNSNFYPFHDYIDDLNQFLRILSPNRCLLVGHSLGALIASCYSAAFPEKVSGLVQIEGYGPLSEQEESSVSRLRQGVQSRDRVRKKPRRLLSSVEEAVARRAKVNEIAGELIAPVVKRGIVAAEGRYAWKHDSKLQTDSLYRMSPSHAAQVMKEIQCPMLTILGEQGFEHIHSQSEIRGDERELGTERQRVVIEGGHHCHLESPVRVSDLIFGLVNKI